MTDRADEIARKYVNEWSEEGSLKPFSGMLKFGMANVLRAYGRECRNAALEEAAGVSDDYAQRGAPDALSAVAIGDGIRALKEKP